MKCHKIHPGNPKAKAMGKTKAKAKEVILDPHVQNHNNLSSVHPFNAGFVVEGGIMTISVGTNFPI